MWVVLRTLEQGLEEEPGLGEHLTLTWGGINGWDGGSRVCRGCPSTLQNQQASFSQKGIYHEATFYAGCFSLSLPVSSQHFPSQGSSVCSFNPLLNWAPPGRTVSSRRPAAPQHCPVSFPIFSMLTVLWRPRGEVPSFPFQSPTVPSKNSDLRLWASTAFLWSKLLSKQDVFHTKKLTRIQSDWREEEWDDHSFLQFLGEFSTRQGIGLLVQLLWTLNSAH